MKHKRPANIKKWVPCTPAGSMLVNISADTRHQAIKNLMEDAGHMPYETWKDFVNRGYTIIDMEAG
ncbi:hypothetical protein KAR91_24475 [Candidatus Pacearchaeota archaeon]|nr:hypothetical protein [Candidatus Pacearchaeota archaeon]